MKLLYLGLLAVLATVDKASADCLANNCLRAVRASMSLGPHIADCSSYFIQTVTPATVTVTDTVSFFTVEVITKTQTTIETIEATLVNTQSDTLTQTVSQTNTETIQNTVTVTVPSVTSVTSSTTVTITQSLTTTITSNPFATFGKRSATVNATPAYASPCISVAAYSSACSCIGVTARTVTLPAPSYTTRVSTTLTGYETVSPTVTSEFTTTDATRTTLITVATVTNTVTKDVQLSLTETTSITRTDTLSFTQTSTVTQTNIVATQTVSPQFLMQVTGSNQWTGQYIMYSNVGFAFTTSKPSATQFYINPDKLLICSSGVAFAGLNLGIDTNYVLALPYSTAMNYNPLRCSIDSGTLAMNCIGDGTGYNTWGEYPDSNNGNRPGLVIGTYQAVSSGSIGQILIGLKAVPVS